MEKNFPRLVEVLKDNEEDSLVDLMYQACRFDCLDLLEFECFKLYGHDRLTKLTNDQETELVLRCRPRVARRALRLGYRPKD